MYRIIEYEKIDNNEIEGSSLLIDVRAQVSINLKLFQVQSTYPF